MTYNGEVYINVNSIAGALNKTVVTDVKNNSINITDSVTEEKVGTVDELIKVIGSNRSIILKGGSYVLDKGLEIKNVSNLAISAEKGTTVNILARKDADNVMSFINSDHITVSGIKISHIPAGSGYCTGGMLGFTDCTNVKLTGMDLDGYGKEGLNLNNVDTFDFSGSTVSDCTNDILTVQGSTDISFENSVFSNNTNVNKDDFINVLNSSNVVFNDCDISDNKYPGDKSDNFFAQYAIFNSYLNLDVSINDTSVNNNDAGYFVNALDAVKFSNVTSKGNDFRLMDARAPS